MDYQKFLFFGNLTEAPQVQKPEGKTSYADFTVAVSRGKERETDFFPVRVFGKTAELAEKLQKGSRVFIEGRLEIGRYVPEDGDPKKTIRVLANVIRFI